MELMTKSPEKHQIINWGEFFALNSPLWKESDALAYISVYLSLSTKKAHYSFICKEYLKWGWFYMENSPVYDESREFLVLDVILSLFDEETLSEVAMQVPPPIITPVIPPF